METLKVGDLVVHDQDKKAVLKVEYVYSTVPKCKVTYFNNPDTKFDVYTKNLTKAPPITVAEHHFILTSLSSKIVGDLIKIPGYEAFILIDGKPFQLKKDDNEL